MQDELVGLAHIGIYTRDLDASIVFYRELGFSLDGISQPGARLGFMSLGTCVVELIQPEDLSRLDGLSGGIIAHFAIDCRGIDTAVEKLREKGIIDKEAVIRGSDRIAGGIRNIFFTGPSGERIELFEHQKA